MGLGFVGGLGLFGVFGGLKLHWPVVFRSRFWGDGLEGDMAGGLGWLF